MPDTERIRALFDQTADLPAGERAAFLDDACQGEPALRAIIDDLLAHDARFEERDDADFLKSPLVLASPSDLPSTPALPQTIGGYRIVRRIGEGGMGTVYEAEQDEPRRTVALKVMRPGSDSADLRKRFAQEANILGRLRHAGIAQVYEAGTAADGQLYFAMEFIRGLPLDEHVRRRASDVKSRLELMARVCDAVQHAHEQGIVHRDLKPANILVDESGQPKVLDFGVAQASGAGLLVSTAHTRTGQLIGTLGYMSPEQVAADPKAVDARSDVYSLGVILYELLADRLPYHLDNLAIPEVLRVIREEEPSLLGSVNRQFRGAVETIVAKALEKDKARRYASAGALAQDLRRYLADEPIQARPASPLYRLQRFVTRHRKLVAGTAVVFAALVGATILSLLSARDAKESARLARLQTYQARLAAAVNALSNHDVADAVRHLEQAPEELRGWEWRHLQSRLDDHVDRIAAEQGAMLFLLRRPPSPLPLSPEGERGRGEGGIQVGQVVPNKHLRLMDLSGGHVRTIPLTPSPLPPGGRGEGVRGATTKGAILDLHGELRFSSWRNNDLKVWDEATLPPLDLAPTNNTRLSPDGTCVAASGIWSEPGRADVALYDAASGKRKAVCIAHKVSIWYLAFSRDSKRLASADDDGLVCIWNVETGAKIAECRGHASKVLSVVFRADGGRMVTASADGTVRQWDATTGREIEPPFDRHTGEVLTAAYSPNGEWIASAGADHTIRLWLATGRQEVAVLHGHAGAVNELAFTPDGRQLVSVSQDRVFGFLGDNTVGIWALDAASLPVLRGHTSYVYPVAYSPDGCWIASGSWDHTIRLWDAATGEECAAWKQPGIVRALAFSPDGESLICGGDFDDELRILDTATGQVRQSIRGPACKRVQYLALSPDGKQVAVGSLYGADLKVLDIANGSEVGSAPGLPFAYSPDGKWLAGRDAEGKNVVLWDAQDLRPIAVWPGHTDAINAVAFQKDGKRLLSASGDHTVRVWETSSGKCLRVFDGHTDKVYAAVFHPDGTRIASAGRDRTILIWDPASDQEGVRLPGHTSYVWSLAFSPDGKSLVSGSGDTTVRLWDTEPLRTRFLARREAEALRPDAEHLVDRLFREKRDAAAVAAAVRTDSSLSDSQRKAALRAVLKRFTLRQ